MVFLFIKCSKKKPKVAFRNEDGVQEVAPMVIQEVTLMVVEEEAPVVVQEVASMVIEEVAPVAVQEVAPMVVEEVALMAVQEEPRTAISTPTKIANHAVLKKLIPKKKMN
jgi:hypothetical protein